MKLHLQVTILSEILTRCDFMLGSKFQPPPPPPPQEDVKYATRIACWRLDFKQEWNCVFNLTFYPRLNCIVKNESFIDANEASTTRYMWPTWIHLFRIYSWPQSVEIRFCCCTQQWNRGFNLRFQCAVKSHLQQWFHTTYVNTSCEIAK